MDMLLEQFKTIFDRPEKVKKLRNLILQLAVKGKLVEQDENDEPASVLLERIKEEKEKLIKEGKIKKSKPLPEISEDEKPYELPEGWEWIRLGKIITLKGGKRVPKGYELKTEPTKHIYIRITDMKDGTIKDYNLRYIDDNVYEKIKNYIITKDDLYITIAGTIGEVGIVPEKFHNMNLTENAARIIPYNVDKIWLKNFLSSSTVKEMLLDKVNQMAQPKLALKRIQDTIIPIPPLNEQKRIVEKVDSLMFFCDNLEKELQRKVKFSSLSSKSVFNSVGNCSSLEKLQENLKFVIDNFKELTLSDDGVKELKNAALQLAVQGKLVPQNPKDEPASVLLEKIKEEKGRLIKEKKIKKEKKLPEISEDEKPYELPSGWEWARLGDICERITKGSSPKWQGVNYIEDNKGVLFITSENVGKYSLILSNKKYLEWKFNEIEPRSILKKGDLLINIVGGSIGRTAIFDLEECCNINQAVCLVRIIEKSVYRSYLLHFMNSNICISYMFDKQVDNARANLSMSNISKFLIPIPPLSEQKRIVEKVDSLMALCDELENKIEKSKKYNEKLMEALLKNKFM
ncbi:restriction endonuclease subunit S [Clostridium sp. 001]|uniref:restriction endonuclease subunit S n=1 Tax=Clostridium sp. 001 TaxID=1970093 RepID=UPI001C2BEA79|nr:restriction endonuclease subunit S [Clostridium sp. 001]QXE19316.1 hypothetical protein B5S50_11045 [Clostridium sp. 001]